MYDQKLCPHSSDISRPVIVMVRNKSVTIPELPLSFSQRVTNRTFNHQCSPAYRVSSKVLLPHINLRTATAIATNLVSWYSKVTMRYTVRSATAPPGAK
ncbi:hypothetical protein AVEN_265626-1 [Araneus ventricosus]|uniref:Uncharacterized protein n=1 Tax=Araneus ventricosus TaxID=182803 RepID=A0A4Y2GEX8_ARAVE|nr:hypothetical protein AVEN_265626-1 [Araneus ventricosus]